MSGAIPSSTMRKAGSEMSSMLKIFMMETNSETHFKMVWSFFAKQDLGVSKGRLNTKKESWLWKFESAQKL